ncbi:Heat shock protein 40 like protein/ DnaJ domain containing protein [Ectocarpus siliculosus]|uniref:Heat shock protein 40 like protein/ DnaJ domain containing protein n=1 Tax=Ectocarpus siliculosus TaxID=2880 RepID=D7G6F0_ECTSI|nr:Heat shock protein 40 like protein/ DnaJ domain containing protein [Ectocarpus siliculosus]|eukprot:CBJ27545.1 Heat shock protein 40 like protein/ DnaJ domain containing protein [Ectocarpus siliculosus]
MSHRLFICCCKGFFRDENGDELYSLLGVDRRATPAEVKRAYRNKSLQMHPDKLNQRGQEVTEQDRANFQKMKSAYDVLSDPSKRELYDQLGETGMLMMEDPFAAKDNMIKNFLRMGTRDRLRLVVFVLLFVGAVLLWPILFCAKVDGDTSASWVALWTPLWIYDALGLWYFVYLVSLGQIKAPEGMEEGWTDPFPLPLRVLALVKWTLLVLFQVFLTMRLDDNIDWSYAVVGSPLLAWMGLTIVGHVYDATRPVPQDRSEESILNDEEGGIPPDVEKREQAIAKRTEARSAVAKDCVWMLQLVFLIIKLDGNVDWNWWLVFFPTWFVLFGQLVGYYVDYSLARSLSAGIEEKEEEDLTQEERVRMVAASQLVVHAASSCCCWVFTLVTVVLAVNAIAGADYSTFVIFIPQFIIAGTLLCCATCFICCMRDLGDLDDDAADPEQGGSGASTSQHLPGSYGTYNPPAMPGGGGASKASPSGAAPPASASTGAAVIAMPPPPPASGSGQQAEVPAAAPAPRPVPATTPAPDLQADGGID